VPNAVDVKLPQQVSTGQQYNFDAFQEPLGDDYLLGAAIEEPIQAGKNFKPPVELELLSAGGLLSSVVPLWQMTAGFLPCNRGDGMTLVTQRLQVVGQNRLLTRSQSQSQEQRARRH